MSRSRHNGCSSTCICKIRIELPVLSDDELVTEHLIALEEDLLLQGLESWDQEDFMGEFPWEYLS